MTGVQTCALPILVTVPLSDLDPIIGPIKEFFASDFMGGTSCASGD